MNQTRVLRTMEEAQSVTAVRLTERRQRAKEGDLFRLSPHPGVVLWGRLIRRGAFFGLSPFNLVYIYDVISAERPEASQLTPENLIIGPIVVNNLGWWRGYWEIVSSAPVQAADTRPRHLFVQFHGTGSPDAYHLEDETGQIVVDPSVDRRSLSQCGFSNFNHVDWLVRGVLEERGVIPTNSLTSHPPLD